MRVRLSIPDAEALVARWISSRLALHWIADSPHWSASGYGTFLAATERELVFAGRDCEIRITSKGSDTIFELDDDPTAPGIVSPNVGLTVRFRTGEAFHFVSQQRHHQARDRHDHPAGDVGGFSFTDPPVA